MEQNMALSLRLYRLWYCRRLCHRHRRCRWRRRQVLIVIVIVIIVIVDVVVVIESSCVDYSVYLAGPLFYSFRIVLCCVVYQKNVKSGIHIYIMCI
jgi:predicted neutral ceramidase superfamily lipid hydrolase